MKFFAVLSVLLLAFATVSASECPLEASRDYVRSYCSANEKALAPMPVEQCQAHLAKAWELTLYDDKAVSIITDILPVNGTLAAGSCGVGTGVACAGSVAGCLFSCRGGWAKCVACMGGAFNTCCPCLAKFGIRLNC